MFLNRSTLSNGSSNNNKTATNRNRLTLSSRAGSLNPFFVPIQSPSPIISPKSSPSNIHTVVPYTKTLPTMTSKTITSTVFSTDLISTTSTAVPPQVQIVNIKPNKNENPLPDQYYYYSEHDSDYYDNIDEISIPSSTIKALNKNNSSNSLSQSSTPVKSFIFPNVESELRFKLPALTEPRYDQSTLKSFFMNSQPSTITEGNMNKGISLGSLKKLLTTTEKSNSMKPSARDFEVQRQKILSFIISENQPSSFKAPIITSTTQKSSTNSENNKSSFSPSSSSYVISENKNQFNNAFVNMQKSIESTTLKSYLTTTNAPQASAQTLKTTKLLSSTRDQINYNNKPIRLTLSTNLDSFNKKPTKLVDDQLQMEEIQSIKSRQPERQSLYLKPIEPTTYAPPKPYRVSTETTKKTEISSSTYNAIDNYEDDEIEDVEIEDPESLLTHSRRRPYVNDYISSTSQIPTRFPPRSSTTKVPEILSEILTTTSSALTESITQKSIVQSFTSRGLVFKEILNKTLEPQVHLKPIVSPYISLETQRLTNAIRTTTPRTTNPIIHRETTTESFSSPTSTYRSYFLITAAPKNISTFLFPETSNTIKTTSESPATINTPLVLSNVEQVSSTTEHNRGRYRPYFVSSQVPNSIDEFATPTTYSPRYRFNTRNNFVTDPQTSLTTSELPAVRRKVIRLKNALTTPIEKKSETSSSTERMDITTYTPSKRVFNDNNFIPSPTHDTSDFKPIITKLNEFIRKLSQSTDLFGTSTLPPRNVSITDSLNDLINENLDSQSESVVDVTRKPLIYTKYNFNNNYIKNNNLRNITNLHETSTKKFRATVEMPEMKVPFENESSLNPDEEENYKLPYDDDIDDVRAPSSTNAPLQSTHSSTITETSPDVTQYMKLTMTPLPLIENITTLAMTENNNLVLSTSTTANPKSLIPPRATRVNNQLKSSIIASGLPRRNSNSASIKCNDVSSNAKCNEIPSRYKEKI